MACFCLIYLIKSVYLHKVLSITNKNPPYNPANIAVYLLVCYVRQGFNKNLTPQSAYAFRAFGNSFMVYMVLWEQVLTPIYAINEWEAFASLEKHKRKKPFKTQGYKRMCKTKQIEGKGQIVGANARGSYYLYYLLRFSPISLVLIPSASLCFYMFFRLWARAVHK